jgi:phage head maturation protease
MLSGSLEVYETRTGLEFRATLPNSAMARHLALLVERGDIRGMSISFRFRSQHLTQ